ncbi:biotin synthase auxiliary protein BsaP [Rhodococcoides navarretei]|uniref:Biotin synthase auxiliary protein n=1 Tax=Rhodococcus navarretei TaxID=3128981 RepID=A0ABU9CVC2_9NOCA
MTSEIHYDPYTGRPVDARAEVGTDSLSVAVRLGLEPPRFCAECGRRMVVQIVPDGWTSVCSRHGLVDSAATGRR